MEGMERCHRNICKAYKVAHKLRGKDNHARKKERPKSKQQNRDKDIKQETASSKINCKTRKRKEKKPKNKSKWWNKKRKGKKQ